MSVIGAMIVGIECVCIDLITPRTCRRPKRHARIAGGETAQAQACRTSRLDQTFVGDDVDDTGSSALAVQDRTIATHDLDTFDAVNWDPRQ